MEERIGENASLKVAREVELYFAGDTNITGCQVGKGHPLVLTGVVAGPVSILVDTGASRLEVSWLFLLRWHCFGLTLSDEVVLAGSVDLTPETELGGTSGTSQILQGLLK